MDARQQTKTEWVLALIRDAFTKNKTLKILSFLFAVVIWSVVITTESPPRTRTIYGVPVDVIGYAGLNGRGLTILGGIQSMQYSADVLIEVPRDSLSASENSVTARIDLSGVVAPGGQWVDVVGWVNGGSATCMPRRVYLNVETLAYRVIPVDIIQTGVLPEGFRVNSLTQSPSSITVYGPQSVVDKVARALVTVPLDNITASINSSWDYVLVDASGEQVPMDSIATDDGTAVIVTAEIQPLETKVINKESNLVGNVADGYYLKSVEVSPQSVQISAARETLDAINQLTLAPVDIEGKSETFSVFVDIEKRKDVLWMQHEQVSMLVTIAELEESKVFSSVEVTPLNIPWGMGITYDESMTVRLEVSGARSLVRDLLLEDIEVFFDLAGIGEGGHEVPIQVRVKGEEVASVVMPSTISVVIERL